MVNPIHVYRGATRPDGSPILEHAVWAEDPDGLNLDDQVNGLHELHTTQGHHSNYVLQSLANALYVIPTIPPTIDGMGTVTDWGYANPPTNPYDETVLGDYTLLSRAAFGVLWNAVPDLGWPHIVTSTILWAGV